MVSVAQPAVADSGVEAEVEGGGGQGLTPVVERHWRIKEPDVAVVAALAKACGLSPLVARLLALRGVADAETARVFMAPSLAELADPFALAGMAVAADRLATAVISRERICIYGDYDVDGVTSSALLVRALAQLGADVFYHVPRRLEDGYGMSESGVREVQAAGAVLIVTVDCGITAVKEAALCRTLGLDLIITDHHLPGAELPDALAVVDPLRADCVYPFKKLAGVGVAFNLLVALRRALRDRGFFAAGAELNLRALLDLVALGTVADVVPLVGQNRILVHHGLKELTLGARPGVASLKKVSGIDGPVTCGAVGFKLGPRLNAAGRLADAQAGIDLLLLEDAGAADLLAGQLNQHNLERQAVEQQILEEAIALVESDPIWTSRSTLVLASADWHPGVIGIVASRLVERYHRPTLLIAIFDGVGKASGRSIPAVNLHQALSAVSGHLLKFGGHAQAAGFAIHPDHIPAFAAAFDAAVAATITPADLVPTLAIDALVPLKEASLALVADVAKLEPYGFGNPEPTVLIPGLTILDRRLLKDKHLKLKLMAGGERIEAIGFNMAHRFEAATGTIDLVGNLQVNEWRDNRTVQVRIKDFRAS